MPVSFPTNIQSLLDKLNKVTEERDYWKDKCEKLTKKND